MATIANHSCFRPWTTARNLCVTIKGCDVFKNSNFICYRTFMPYELNWSWTLDLDAGH